MFSVLLEGDVGTRVYVSTRVEKSLRKLPDHVQVLFHEWANLIRYQGFAEMQSIPDYRDHSLKGNLSGLRSSSLNRSYRTIYKLLEEESVYVFVVEVNKHDYKI